MCPLAGSTDVIIHPLLQVILRLSARVRYKHQTVCNIQVSDLYKPTVIYIDIITQQMYTRRNLLHDCLQQIIILAVFKPMNF
jgi:hypothetical protein